ncbi:Metacaspase-9 [Fusarium oxysporum f. sp. albedinis]|nr:Metacaspase-9 [Fusarium oxysporum f. sp. albedinis]
MEAGLSNSAFRDIELLSCNECISRRHLLSASRAMIVFSIFSDNAVFRSTYCSRLFFLSRELGQGSSSGRLDTSTRVTYGPGFLSILHTPYGALWNMEYGMQPIWNLIHTYGN